MAKDYQILVRAKDSAGTIVEKTLTVTVKAQKLANTSKVSATSVTLGNSVTVNASATGGAGGYTYAVYYKKTTDKNWVTKQDYQSNATIKITPAKATEYQICVKAKDSAGTVSKVYFTVAVSEQAKLTNTSKVSAASITLGDSVTINASATGGAGGYTYAVFYKKTTDKNWVTKQDYQSNATIKITPAKATEYQICVKVKDSAGTITKQYFTVEVK